MTRSFLVFLLFNFICLPASSQLFFCKKGWIRYYVEIKKDVAHVEVFTINSHSYFAYKADDDFLTPVNHKNDTIFAGKNNYLLKKKKEYHLLHKFKLSKKYRSVKLVPCDKDERNMLRNNAYSYGLKLKIQELESVRRGSDYSPPTPSILTEEGKTYLYNIDKDLPHLLYKEKVDKLGDSLINQLLQQDTLLSWFYPPNDSLELVDSAILYRMLSEARYYYASSYSNDFLCRLSVKRPEYLINYLESNPANKTEILKAIRSHWQYKEIIENVKQVETSSAARKEIIKQKRKRVKDDIVGVSVVTLLIAAELAGLTLLGIWIF